MPEIRPATAPHELLCAEMPATPNGLVVFGASGDLTRRKLLPSLFDLYRRELIPPRFYFLGAARSEISDEQYRRIVAEELGDRTTDPRAEEFLNRMYYIRGDYDDPDFYRRIQARLDELDQRHDVPRCRIFYLSVPPLLYGAIAEHLGDSGLSHPPSESCARKPALVIEKPFGRDLDSAVQLNDRIRRYFDEDQIYRIDHYLGKETVQNILMFRFANAIFEPVWNRNYVDHVQITIAENLGVGHRGGYYEKSGALRDMFQNHMLSMLALVAMEPPASFEADHIRDEKVKLLRSVRPLSFDPWGSDIIRARYAAGRIDGERVPGYMEEQGVDPGSRTETYVAARVLVDNWRWKDVPFFMRTGKRMPKRITEIAIQFKSVPHSMFESIGLDGMPPNVLVLKIQPEEGIALSFQAKRPGSKACMGTLNMNFNYADVFGGGIPEAYQRLLLDCMLSDQTLFTRQDEVEVAWRLVTPVLQAWVRDDSAPYEYPAGAESFPQADALIQASGTNWRRLGASAAAQATR